MGHNTSLKPKKNTAFDQTIPAGASTVYQPKAEEDQPFPVACAIHPWMKSWMIMRGNGYFAVKSTLEVAAKVNAVQVPTGFYEQTAKWHVTYGDSDQDR